LLGHLFLDSLSTVLPSQFREGDEIRSGDEPTCLMMLLARLSFSERTCSLVFENRRMIRLACLTHLPE
jgi:hypothetical protein